MVTVSNSFLCTNSDTVNVVVESTPAINIGNDTSICQTDLLLLNAGTHAAVIWSTGAITSQIEVGPGTYTVQVYSVLGCENSDDIVISAFASISVNNQSYNCTQDNLNYTTSFDISGGNGSVYTVIDESSGLPTGVVNGNQFTSALIASNQSYSFLVFDGANCDTITVQGIHECVAIQLPVDLGNDTSLCPGESLLLDAGIYDSYLWSTGETTQTITVSQAGQYWLAVSDAGNNQGSDTINISYFNGVIVDLGQDAAICDGDSYTLDAGTFSAYAWSTLETTQTIVVNTAGTFTVTVTDSNGCEGEDSFVLSINPLPVVDLGLDMAICDGDSYTLDAGTFSAYVWSTLETTQTIVVNTAGTFTVTVTDSNGCEGEDSFVLNINPLPVVDLGLDMAMCDGDSYTLDAGTFSAYAWSTLETTQIIVVNTAGTFTVTVTDSNGCEGEDSFVLNINPLPVVDLGLDMAICDGDSYTLDAGTFSAYAWSTLETTQIIVVNTAGTFTVTVTDSNGCEGEDSFVLNINPLPVVDLGLDMAICDGDSYTLDAGTFSAYAWSTLETTQTIVVNTAGTFTVTVTDSNGCEGEDSFVLSINPLPVVDLGLDMAICNGDSYTLDAGTFSAYAWSTLETTQTVIVNTAGTFTVTVTGSNGCEGEDSFSLTVNPLPLVDLGPDAAVCIGSSVTLDAGNYSSYVWSTLETTQTISVNTAGTYMVTVTDINGCEGEDSFALAVNQYAYVNLGPDTDLCAGESLTLDAGNFATYLWSTQEISQTIIVSTAGTYTVQVSDANGCQGGDTIVIGINQLPVVDLGPDAVLCFGEMHLLNAGIFQSYQWSTLETSPTISVGAAGTYSVTVTDGNGCEGEDSFMLTVNALPIVDLGQDMAICDGESFTLDAGIFQSYIWSTLETTQTIVVNTAGTFSVTVTDSNGCEGEDSFMLTVIALPIVDLGQAMTICDDESYTLDAGTFQSYAWSTLEISQTIVVNTSGIYTVTVTDSNGCEGEDSFTLIVNPLPVVDLGPDMDICDGNTITLDAGIFPTYVWSTLETTQSIIVNTAGSFTVTVTDSNGCEGEDSFTLTVNPLPVTDLGPDVTICDGDSYMLDAGTFQSYDWSSFENTQTILVNIAGIYSVTVTDGNGCEGEDSFTLTINPLPVVNLGPDQFPFEGTSVTLDPGSFTSYLWSNGSSNQLFTVTTSGTYTVTVTDVNGCENSDNVVITFVPPLTDPPYIVAMAPAENTVLEDWSTLYITGNDPDYDISHLEIRITKSEFPGDSVSWFNIMVPVGPLELSQMNNQYLGIAEFFHFSGIFIVDINTEAIANSGLGFPGWGAGTYTFWYALHDSTGLQSAYWGDSANLADHISYVIEEVIVTEQLINLLSGYTMFSTYIDPVNPSIAAVLDTISAGVLIVKNSEGKVYWPAFGFNNIGNMSIGEGYQIFMANPAQLWVVGDLIDPVTNPVTIASSWSLLGYLRTTPAPIIAMMSPIISNVVVVKNSIGNIYWPFFSVDFIGNMNPGEGYKIKLNNLAILTYPANTTAFQKSFVEIPQTIYYDAPAKASPNMTLCIPNESWNGQMVIGDEVGVYKLNGEVIGAAKYTGRHMVIPIPGHDDLLGNSGLLENESFILKRWSYIDNSESTYQISSFIEGNYAYIEDKLVIAGTVEKLSEHEMIISNPFPTPADESISLDVHLTRDQLISLTVYSITGQLIQKTIEINLPLGYQKLDIDCNNYPDGEYLIHISSKDQTLTRKAIVIH